MYQIQYKIHLLCPFFYRCSLLILFPLILNNWALTAHNVTHTSKYLPYCYYLLGIICFGRIREFVIIVVKHAQPAPSVHSLDVCFILICRNVKSLINFPCVAYTQSRYCGAVNVMVCVLCLRRPFFHYEFLCNRK